MTQSSLIADDSQISVIILPQLRADRLPRLSLAQTDFGSILWISRHSLDAQQQHLLSRMHGPDLRVEHHDIHFGHKDDWLGWVLKFNQARKLPYAVIKQRWRSEALQSGLSLGWYSGSITNGIYQATGIHCHLGQEILSIRL